MGSASTAQRFEDSLHPMAELSGNHSMNASASYLAVALVVLASCATQKSVIAPAHSSASTAASSKPSSADEAMREAYSAALQGGGRAAVDILAKIDPDQLSERNRTTRGCMIERLDARIKPDANLTDPFIADVLSAYQEYWLRSMRAEQPVAANESALLATLNGAVLSVGGNPSKNLDDLELTLISLIRARGYHSLHGMTLPFREFMLWKVEDEMRYEVALPLGLQPVTVVFMDGFVSLGWAAFATCDRAHTGGWTKPDRLYAVRSAYDLESESFHVSYLAHEAQHFADIAAFPQLEQPELEFRAKLTEFSLSHDTTYELLEQFAANRSADREVPHSFANGQVVDALEARLKPDKMDGTTNWRSIDVARINAAARALLMEDTAYRRKLATNRH